MSSPLSTATVQRTTPAGKDLLPNLNLTALEQQFFVEWEVPEPDESRDGSVAAG